MTRPLGGAPRNRRWAVPGTLNTSKFRNKDHCRRTLRSPTMAGAASGRAVRLDIERVQGMTRRHVEPVVLRSAKSEVGAALGQANMGERLAFRTEHHDAVEILRLALRL